MASEPPSADEQGPGPGPDAKIDGAEGRVTYPRLGAQRVPYIGLPRDGWRDAYHVLLTLPTAPFLGVLALAFVAINAVFALLYMADPGGVTNARPGNFQDAFFFSVQTLGTLGYGVMAPKSLAANLTATLETFVGLANLAIATGLLFARISRPTARIMFSKRAVVTAFDGVPTLIFRAANQRRNLVIEADVTVTMVHDVTTREGSMIRRFDELVVLRSRSPLFFLTWQVMHPIDEKSPLFGETTESLLEKRAEVLVVMKGIDETFVTTIHARTSYTPDEIVWDAQLADIFTVDEHGMRAIDFRRFHEIRSQTMVGPSPG
jgi:inward rectifier potassium channel